MRRAARVDGNQQEIVDALLKAGRSVFIASSIGRGFPDLVVGHDGKTYLLEVKTEKGKKTPHQDMFVAYWRGSEVHIVRSPEDAIKITGL
jgi:hypothetical protein